MRPNVGGSRRPGGGLPSVPSRLRPGNTLRYLANAHLNPLNIGLWFRGRSSYKLLIIDELGFVALSKTGAELLFERCCHVKFLWLERSEARGYSGDTGRNFPCIESFEPMVANCLRGAATGRN